MQSTPFYSIIPGNPYPKYLPYLNRWLIHRRYFHLDISFKQNQKIEIKQWPKHGLSTFRYIVMWCHPTQHRMLMIRKFFPFWKCMLCVILCSARMHEYYGARNHWVSKTIFSMPLFSQIFGIIKIRVTFWLSRYVLQVWPQLCYSHTYQ